ncbi:MAG: 1-acyl-sn-glycerol-3-phosphate acyltransferase [Pseudomonadota bacterium]|nr:1-acyl-sn-glycerol-3-phosphate acyltransferase [Pseudomonadota bacterium]
MASRPNAAADPISSRWRAYARIAGLALLVLTHVPLHLIAKRGGRPSPWPRRFLGRAAFIAGARVQIEGAPLAPHNLVLANHSSWLDILILGGAGTRFVSKAEIGRVPLIGWLADQNQTLYIERSERGDAHGQVRRIAGALGHQQPLTVFPEGTTSDGCTLLPFRSTLLHAVAPPPPGVNVRPVALVYDDSAAIAWHGEESGLANAMRVLGMKGQRRVTVRLLDPLPPTTNRKALARSAHAAVRAALSSVARRDTLEAAAND